MPKPPFLPLAMCVALAGCTVFKKSRTWDAVVRTRPRVADAADPSAAYADHLHRVLAARGVEHRIVTYEFHFTTHLREEAVGSRTAVLYRDDTDPAHPWWLTDERQPRPRWLPNGSVEKQVSFFARGSVDIVRLRDFPGSADAKRTVTTSRRFAAFRVARLEPLRALAAGPEVSLRALFRTRHGTDFDARSTLDRGKMIALRHAAQLR